MSFLSACNVISVARGYVGGASVTDNQARTSTSWATAVDLAPAVVPVTAGRRYKVTGGVGQVAATFSSGTPGVTFGIGANATQMTGWAATAAVGFGTAVGGPPTGTATARPRLMYGYWVAAVTGNATFAIRGWMSGAAVTSWNISGGSVWVDVEDVGAAS